MSFLAGFGSMMLAMAMQPASARALPTIIIPPADGRCFTGQADIDWIGRSLAAWQFVAAEKLKLSGSTGPQMVFFDQRCRYVLPAGDRLVPVLSASLHEGEIAIPSGETIPASVVSFASPGKDGADFFVMSLPSVWTAQGVTSALGVDVLTTGVMLHELMHTSQFHFANPTLEALGKRYNLADDISDDSLQAAFKDDARYAAAYRQETDLLYRAAAAPGEAEARRLAGEALAKMRQRRARFFKGANAQWAPLDEIFLTMEGLGQWTMYAWLTDPRGRNLDPAVAQQEVRRGNKHWSQEQGLALFLVIDRLVPEWQKLAFAEKPEAVEALLARAAAR